MASDYVEGDGNYNYSHGDNVARVKVTAGDHRLRVSWPDLANHPNPFGLINADGRQELFVDYMRILGPFNPSTPSPTANKKIFVCVENSPACARQIVTNLITRAYRRPATPDEVQRLLDVVNDVRKQDPLEHAVQLAIEAVLVSPNFLFRIERDPETGSGGVFRSAGRKPPPDLV